MVKKNKFTILGKSHNMISLLIDIIVENNSSENEIQIVKNIPVHDTPEYKFNGSKNLKYKKTITYNDWKPSGSKILMGVIRVPTKLIVYKAFSKTHSIQKNKYSQIFHPSSLISKQTIIGSGTMIGPGSILGPFVDVGSLVSINRGVRIGHHTTIGDFCTLNPGSNIAGGTKIGQKTTIGMGTNIIDGINIGENTVIGAGSVVTKSIPDNVIAYGSPAKVIRSNS